MKTIKADKATYIQPRTGGVSAATAGVLAAFALLAINPAAAATYLYPASCGSSYSKQGEQSADLTKQAGRPVKCDGVILSFLDNGNVQVQVVQKTSQLTPLGFAGTGIDYAMNPNMATIPLERIYLPHASNPGIAQVVDGIEGFCFLGGKINVRSLTNIACSAKMEIGTQKLVYNIQVKINGLGEQVPGL